MLQAVAPSGQRGDGMPRPAESMSILAVCAGPKPGTGVHDTLA